MPPALCPHEQTLQRMLLGHLSGEQASELEDHLSTCDDCARTAARMADSDELIDAMKQVGAVEADDSATRLIARLQAMQAESLNTQLDETHSRTPKSSADELTQHLPEADAVPNGELSFLDPPQTDEELGRLGRFRVLEILGRGGMGVVLRAEDPTLRREVAIKVLNLKSLGKSDAAARFLREAQATAAIDHDNIVTIHDVGEHSGMPYYAMQFLRGESLHARLAHEKQLPIAEAVRIAREIAQGLSAAHAKGLLHRDIKPANIWLEAETDRAKIVDFGLARIDDHEDGDLTNSGAVLGTPKYMSPEQALGDVVDPRSDLFSLGSVLYHLVAGQPPFSGSNVTATLIAVANGTYEDIQSHRPDCPESLQAIIDQLLKKPPDDRFATAVEVVAALKGVEDELAIAPPPIPNLIPPATSPSQGRSRYATWVALAAVPLFILLGVVFLWRTPQGTLRVEVNDPRLEVLIDGDELKLTDTSWEGKKKAGRRRLRLKLGNQELKLNPESVFRVDGDERKHQLSVNLNGTKLSSNEFEVLRDQQTVLTIRLTPTAKGPPADVGRSHPQNLQTDSGASPLVDVVPRPQPNPKSGTGEGYDELARGKWLNLFDLHPPHADGKNVRFENGVLELANTNLKFPAVAGRNMILRAKIKKKSGFDVAIKVRSQKDAGGYTAWLNERYSLGLAVDKTPKAKDLYARQLKEFAATDDDGFVELAVAAINDRFHVYLNNKQIINVSDDSFDSGFVEIGTYLNGRGFFKNVQVMLLESEPASSSGTMVHVGQVLASQGEPLDLLTIVDPANDSTGGEWKLSTGRLRVTELSSGSQTDWSRLQVPVIPQGDYQLDLTFEPTSNNDEQWVNVFLPVKGNLFRLKIARQSAELFAGRERETFDGSGFPLTPLQAYAMRVIVRHDNGRTKIDVSLDGLVILQVDEKFDSREIEPDRQTFVLEAHAELYDFTKLELRMLDGIARTLRPSDAEHVSDAEVQPFTVFTGDLVTERFLSPVGKVPSGWRKEGVFAEIKGRGELQFPRLEVTEFALDMDVTVRDPYSDLLITHGAPHDRWRSEVRLAHTEPDDDGKLLRVLPIRRRDGQFFMPGHTNAPLNEKFRLTITSGENALCIYINGKRRLRQQDVQPDLHLTLSANSESADAAIHNISYRPLTEAERNDLER